MPLFEYECEECGVRFERLHRKGDQTVKKCPECGGSVRRLIQPPGIIFKGSGFYVTDNRRSSAGTRRTGDKESGEGSPGEKSESKPAKGDSE
jgi:putative FmdB family regulatory protein